MILFGYHTPNYLVFIISLYLSLTVEIDKSLFLRSKNNTGRVLTQQWVFDRICRETRYVFTVCIFNINIYHSNILISHSVIQNHIVSSSIIISVFRSVGISPYVDQTQTQFCDILMY